MHRLKMTLAQRIPGLPSWVRHLRQPVNREPIPYWYEPNFFQSSVMFALEDLCPVGGVVFDVGANVGQTAVPLSRLVGPQGVVCAFEASPRLISSCQANLVNNGCHNVTLYQRAIYHQSEEYLKIYHHPTNSAGDSLYREAISTRFSLIRSLALDDFVAETGLKPSLIKMDIEEAEVDALRGMTQILTTLKPHLVIEEHLPALPAYHFLAPLGYLALDLSTYQFAQSVADFPADYLLTDVVFIHADRLAETPYRPPLRVQLAEQRPPEALLWEGNTLTLREPLHLPTGRSIIHLNYRSEDREKTFNLVIENDEKVVYQHQGGDLWFQTRSNRYMVLQLPTPQTVQFKMKFREGRPAMNLLGLEVFHLEPASPFKVPILA